MEKLERELAYTMARIDIESYCKAERHSGRYHGVWYDTAATYEDCPNTDAEDIARAFRYLEYRNLLKHHPENPALVRILDA